MNYRKFNRGEFIKRIKEQGEIINTQAKQIRDYRFFVNEFLRGNSSNGDYVRMAVELRDKWQQ